MLAGFGVDTLDPGVSARRVWVLANRLPAPVRALGDPWSPEAELLALLVDHVANLTYVTLRCAGVKQAPRPKPLPRPTRGRERPVAAEPQPRPEGSGSWLGAAKQLAAIPGVVVTDRG